MDYLAVSGKTFLVAGVANKKSVAWHVAARLREFGAEVVYTVHTSARRAQVEKLVPGARILVCDVEREEDIAALAAELARTGTRLDGLVHSIAFAPYESALAGGGESAPAGAGVFHATRKADFMRAVDVSCFSLIALSNALKDIFDARASVVTISISTTRMAALNYGYMAPVKAALDSTVVFLAKSFSTFSQVRFNSVNPALLKTSSSAGIPGYLESYLYAEQATLRKRALATAEVADAVLFLLSERSSGINAQGIVLDAGMSVNFFDRDLVERAVRVEERT